MKWKMLCGIITALVISTGGVQAQKDLLDYSFTGLYLSPHQDVDWDSAIGLEARVIYWHLEELGWAFTIGHQTWTPNEDQNLIVTPLTDGRVESTSQLSGDATMIPIGASLVYRGEVGESIWAHAELGIRYVLVDSAVKMEDQVKAFNTKTGEMEQVGGVFDNDIDNGIVAMFSANMHFPIGSEIELFIGGGGQLDMVRANQKIDGVEIERKNSQQGFFIHAGITW